MAISFVGSAENSVDGGADVTITLPTGTTTNDLVIVAYAIGDNDDVNFNMAMVTAGYTEVADLFANDAQDTNLGVFWKIMGGTPDTTATVDGLGGADAAVAAVCMVFRGINTTTPLDVTSETDSGFDTYNPNPPLISWVTPGTWIVIAGASGHTLGGAGTYTFPTGYTTNAIDRGENDTSDVTVGMGYKTAPNSPENPGIMDHDGLDLANYSWCAVTMALRDAAVTTLKTLPAIVAPIATLTRVTTYARTLSAITVPTATLTTEIIVPLSSLQGSLQGGGGGGAGGYSPDYIRDLYNKIQGEAQELLRTQTSLKRQRLDYKQYWKSLLLIDADIERLDARLQTLYEMSANHTTWSLGFEKTERILLELKKERKTIEELEEILFISEISEYE